MNFEYSLKSVWPVSNDFVSYEITIQGEYESWQPIYLHHHFTHTSHGLLWDSGSYEFLHDLTCRDKKPIKSPFRSAVLTKFWSDLKLLVQGDQLLAHLHSLRVDPAFYDIPENLLTGTPLFCFQPNSNKLVYFSKYVTDWTWTLVISVLYLITV